MENSLLGYTQSYMRTHTDARIGTREPCHLTERDLLAYCRSPWHSDHLLSPANTQHTVGNPKPQTDTHACAPHTVLSLCKQASFFFLTCAFSSALILITVLSPLHPPFSPSTPCLFHFPSRSPNPPLTSILLMPPSSKQQHPSCSCHRPYPLPPETTSPRLLPSHSAWLVPMYS